MRKVPGASHTHRLHPMHAPSSCHCGYTQTHTLALSVVDSAMIDVMWTNQWQSMSVNCMLDCKATHHVLERGINSGYKHA